MPLISNHYHAHEPPGLPRKERTSTAAKDFCSLDLLSKMIQHNREKERQSRNHAEICVSLLLCAVLVFGAFRSTAAAQVALTPDDLQSSGIPSSATASSSVESGSLSDDYLIGDDDVLNILVMDVPELSRQYRVSGAGTISVPMLPNPVPAAGLTLTEFSNRLAQKLKISGLVSNPHISTSVDQSRLHAVAITGAVKRPQVYPLFTRTTLLDMISQSEGLADDAGEVAIVQRGKIGNHISDSVHPENANLRRDSQQTLSINLKQLLDGHDVSSNVDIYPGDRITIPRAGIVYVVGAVHKPGGFAMQANTHGMTVLQAIALAENTTNTAISKQSVIIRSDASAPDGRKQIPVDLKKLLQGKGPDPVLQAEDVLFVPDSRGKRALHRTVDSILQVTTGVAIYSARF
jgi:polysaccharide biosynthesis/export protein